MECYQDKVEKRLSNNLDMAFGLAPTAGPSESDH